MASNQEFAGRRVLITGGARGLGRTTAEAFMDLGAEVIVMDKEAAELANFKRDRPQVRTIEIDVTDWNKIQAEVEKLGPINHVVNNAGVGGGIGLSALTEADVDMIFNINFKSAVSVTQSAVKQMPEGGTVVNIGSIFSTNAFQGGPMYSCSKAAILMLTKCQALEYGNKKIRVNCVRPAFMATGIFGPNQQVLEWFRHASVPLQVLKESIQTTDTANLILFLSSDKSRMITGEDIVIDGGRTITHFANQEDRVYPKELQQK